VLVVHGDVHSDAAEHRLVEHLDVREQAAGDQPRLDRVDHVGLPVVARVDVSDQLDRIGRGLGVALDHDLFDLLGVQIAGKCTDQSQG